MKSTITSISFAVLCSLLSLDTASAFMGFSFGNLLFAVNLCKLPGPRCHANCHGLLKPRDFCDNQCDSRRRLADSSSGTTIMWTQAACDNMSHSSPAYQSCMDGAVADCEEAFESDLSYTDYSEYSEYSDNTSSFVGGDTNESNGGLPGATKMSFLPYVIAASVATMFLMMYAWKKRRDDEQLRKEDLLADEAELSGAVARRFQRATTIPSAPVGPEYALA